MVIMAQLIPYDDRDGWIWLNGEMVPWREARVHVLSHGLHYGTCVFEGERCYGGQVFKLTEHSQRLVDSGKILGFDVPYTVAEIDAATKAVVAKNGFKDCYVRPLAWRGSEQMGVSAQKSRINVAIATWEWGAYYSDLRLTRAIYDRPAPSTAPVHSKAAGLYMICTISKHAAEAQGLRRCADARLAGLSGRDDRGQHLPRHRRRAPHAHARLLPQRHHPAHRDRARPGARASRSSSGTSCPRS